MPIRKYDSDIATGAYPVDLDKPNGQPKVAKIISNKTVLVLPVNPNTANQSTESVPAPNLAAVVSHFRPSLQFDVSTSNDITDLSKQEFETANEECEMQYGADDPRLVMEDFTEEGLIAKMTSKQAGPGASEITRRPLLDQRLKSVAIDDLLEKMTARDKDQKPNDPNNKFTKMLVDPKQRAGLLAALDEEIGRIQALIDAYKLEQASKDM